MRLIEASTLEMKEFFNDFPPYAILSHTWGEEEVSFQDFQDIDKASQKRGYSKIFLTCKQAVEHGVQWCWIDTCCIDKTSSAELSEAINSMYAWYRDSKFCYAYLGDISPHWPRYFDIEGVIETLLPTSRWFTRGWTLQELLAPSVVIFYSADWRKITTKREISEVYFTTGLKGVPARYLRDSTSVFSASVAERMSWMSTRVTTRKEDMAYCMLGIFQVNMPLLYGEGSRSFTRLQEEILRRSIDQTIFCWNWKPNLEYRNWKSILSPSPSLFGFYKSRGQFFQKEAIVRPYHLTNAGLSISLPLIPSLHTDIFLAVLEAVSGFNDYFLCIPVRRNPSSGTYCRLSTPNLTSVRLLPDMSRSYENIYLDTVDNNKPEDTGNRSQSTSTPEVNLKVLMLDVRDAERNPLPIQQWLSSINAFYDSQQSLIEFKLDSENGPRQGFVVFRGTGNDSHWYCFVGATIGTEYYELYGIAIRESFENPSEHLDNFFDRLMSGERIWEFNNEVLRGLTWKPMNRQGSEVDRPRSGHKVVFLSDHEAWRGVEAESP